MISENKRGQVSLFVIIGLLVVVAIVMMFVLINKPGLEDIEENPQAYISQCVRGSLDKIHAQILDNNGYFIVGNNTFTYYGEEIPYLCKSSEFYSTCVNQEPAFVEKIRKDIDREIKDNILSCFNALVEGFEDRNYDVEQGELSYKIIFDSEEIIVSMNKDIKITKDSLSNSFDSYSAKINSPIYRLFRTAETIVNYESQYCQFDEVNWMRFNRDIKINRFRAGEQTKAYTLTDLDSGKEIKFAVRTCILPAGI